MGGNCASKRKKADPSSRNASGRSTATDGSPSRDRAFRVLGEGASEGPSSATCPEPGVPSLPPASLEPPPSSRVPEQRDVPEHLTPRCCGALPRVVSSLLHGHVHPQALPDTAHGFWRNRSVVVLLLMADDDRRAGVFRKPLTHLHERCLRQKVDFSVVNLHGESMRHLQRHPRFLEFCLETISRLCKHSELIPLIVLPEQPPGPSLPSSLQTRFLPGEVLPEAGKSDAPYRRHALFEEICILDPGAFPEGCDQAAIFLADLVGGSKIAHAAFPYFDPTFVQEALAIAGREDLHQQIVVVGHSSSPSPSPPEDPLERYLHHRAKQVEEELQGLADEDNLVEYAETCGGSPSGDNEREGTSRLDSLLVPILDRTVDSFDRKDQPFWPTPPIEETLREVWSHSLALRSYQNACVDRPDGVIPRLIQFLSGGAVVPCVLVGESGSGKSCAVARVADKAGAMFGAYVSVVYREVGTSVDSLRAESLAIGIIRQICFLHDLPCCTQVQRFLLSPADFPLLEEPLVAAGGGRLLLIILDGLDKLLDAPSPALEWLLYPPAAARAKVLLTATPSCAFCSRLARGGALLLRVESFQAEDAEIFLTNLPAARRAPICSGDRWRDILSTLRGGADPCHLQVETILRAIYLSRHGVGDARLSELAAGAQLLPCEGSGLWHFLAHALDPWLRRILCGACSVVAFRYDFVRDVVARRYFRDREEELEARLDYLQHQASLLESESGETDGTREVTDEGINPTLWRAFLEVLHGRLESLEKGTTARDYLTDPDWLERKVEAVGAHEVLGDLNLALEAPGGSSTDLRSLRDLLEASRFAFFCERRQFFAQVLAHRSLAPPFLVERLLQETSRLHRDRLLPQFEVLSQAGPPLASLGLRTAVDRIVAYRWRSHLVVAVCTEAGKLVVWNVDHRERVLEVSDLDRPRDLRFTDKDTAVVLCNRELLLYDLSQGQFLSRLKGMMNQSVPSFDRHDSGHVVTLARNRMYVNLIRLETGDCVTTFKVGEDRFLNSLLVSADGKVCVCGDETQKPFPLLVWDLAARKLRHDLRVPLHEFLTGISAIAEDGRYFCTACKEVSGDGPSFLIAFDLEAGAPFQRWKPSVNPISVAMAYDGRGGGVLVSGLEDCRVVVWDLLNGACRWTLYGHSHVPDCLQLDAAASLCLSRNSQGLDPTFRIHDLERGSLHSAYTADRRITACLLTDEGRHVAMGLAGSEDVYLFSLIP